MDKEHISRDAFFAIYDFLDNDNGPRCLIDELDGFRYYFCSSSWIERATLDVFSNGVYLGEVDSNHRRHGIGVYVFNNGGIYLGEWSQGERDGRGFYYSGGQVFWGEWSAGEKDGRGHIWQVNYESEGIYAKGREKPNMYTRTPQGYKRGGNSNSSSSSSGGCCGLIVGGIIIFMILKFIGCID